MCPRPLTGGFKCRALVEKLPGLPFGVRLREVKNIEF